MHVEHDSKRTEMKELSLVFLFLLFFSSCLHQEKRDARSLQQNISGNSDNIYDLDHIQETGELIAVTISGRDTYYKYKGKNWGVQFELCQAFANSIGARLRMETVRDTNELFVKLKECEADIIALEIPQTYSISSDVCYAGSWFLTDNGSQGVKQQWVVRKSSPQLKEALDKWYMPSLRTYLTERENSYFLPSPSSNRKVHAPILNRKKGVISPYDATFIRHAPSIGWDWRLLAAQCYQESAFDTQAISWAGAVGLMQIMPETAEHLNINSRHLQQPEKNIQAAVLYLRELHHSFSDIKGRMERIHFILAAYNGGAGHVRDAMALARKNGKNPHSWQDVAPYILQLSKPEYYNDPDVQYGYLRGEETYNYVQSIIKRWETYRKVIPGVNTITPQPAKRSSAKKNNKG